MWWAAAAFLALAALGWWVGLVLAPRERARSIERWHAQLSAMADDRKDAVERWVGERFADVGGLAGYLAAAGMAGDPADGPPSRPRQGTLAHRDAIMDLFAIHGDSLGTAVLDAEGRRVGGFGRGPEPDQADVELARECLRAGRPLAVFGLRGGVKPVAHFIAPIVATAPAPATRAILLTADPESWLYPYLQHQPVLSDTAETVLVQQEGDAALFLTPLRHSAAKPLTLRRPLSSPGFAAGAALAGSGEFGEYVDYRGVAVFASARRIRGTPWGMVVKVDREEALAAYRRWLVGTLVGLAAALLATVGLGYGAWHRGKFLITEAAAANERRLAELVNETNTAVFVLSAEGKVLQANRRAEELYGYSGEELRGMTTADLRAPETREGALEVLQQALSGDGALVETVHRRRDGSTFPVEVSVHHADHGGETFLLEAVRDIGAQKAADGRIRRLNRLLRTISEVNQLIVRERDRDRVLKEACRILVEHGEFLMAWVGFADPMGGAVVPAATGGFEDGYLSTITVRFDDTTLGRGPTGTAIREGHAVIVSDWDADERVAPWRIEARRRGYRSSAAFPISVGGKVTGALTVYMGEPAAFDAEVTGLLEELAGDLAFALESLDAAARGEASERGLRESEERFRRLSDAAFEGIAITDQGRLIDVNTTLAELVGRAPDELIGRSALDFVDPADHELVSEHLRSGSQDAYEHLMLRADGTRFPAEVRGRPLPYGGRMLRVTAIRDITERRRADEALHESREMLRESQVIAGLGSYVLDIPSGAWQSSDVLDSVFGIDGAYDRSVDGWATLIHPDDRSTMTEYFNNAVIGKGHRFDREYRIIRRNDQAERWVHGLGELELDVQGRPLRMRGTIQDITERRRADEALRESEARYRTLFDSGNDAIFLIKEGRFVDCNAKALEAFGCDRTQILNHSPADFSPAYQRDGSSSAAAAQDRMRAALVGEPQAFVWLHSRRDLSLFDAEVSLKRIELGGEAFLQAIVRDITAHRQADELRAAIYEISEAAQQAVKLDDLFVAVHRIVGRLMDARNFYIALYDSATNLLSFPYFVDEMDAPPDPFPVGMGMTSYVVHSGRPLLATPEVVKDLEDRREIQPLGADSVDWLGVPLKVQDRVIGVLAVQSYSGRVRYGEADMAVLSYVSAQVAQAIERKRAQDALRESEERFRESIEAFSDGFALIDEQGNVIEWNAALERIKGIKREEALGQPLWDVEWRVYVPERRSPERYEFLRLSVLDAVRTGRLPSPPSQIEICSVDGQRRTVTQGVFGITTQRGFRVGVVTRDITERLALEGQLRQAQKMEAVGSLAGGVAHDFNNLLQALLSQAQLLRVHADNPERVNALGLELGQQISHGAALTRQLLLFSRRETTRPEPLDLNDAVKDATRMLRRLVPANIALEIDLAPGALPVSADRGHLNQVLMNLTLNASDAMTLGGKVTIRTGALDGERVWLTVEDTGTGIPETIRDRIFEPFFTTKGAGKGTGLGLSVVHGIVTQHGGSIEVESTRGEGSRFRIFLPAAHVQEGAVPDEPLVAGEPTAGKGERILLVEDEDAAREGLREILLALGYEVIAAASGEEALALPAQPLFHVLLTDLMLPGISGSQLAPQLQERWPSLSVIMMSGYTQDESVRRRVAGGEARFLQKPFDIATLARELRVALMDTPRGEKIP
jgi:PAS domain S-box-containing protein